MLLSAQLISGVLTVIEGSGSDTVVLTPIFATSKIQVTENGGAPTEFAMSGVSSISVLLGSGNDSLLMGDINNFIWPNATLDGEGGNDTIHAGDGNDSIIGDTGDDSLFGGDHDDTLDGGADNARRREGRRHLHPRQRN
jgi:Ca2+-binding RTX toxin-like protein